MRSIEAMEKIGKFVEDWNEGHRFTNILDLQPVLKMEADEVKVREMKRIAKGLGTLEKDTAWEIEQGRYTHEEYGILEYLISMIRVKRLVLEKVLKETCEFLVDEALHELYAGLGVSYTERQ
jgi:hypothetical protein